MNLKTGFGLFAFLPFTLLACSGGGTSVATTSSSPSSTSTLTSVCAGNYSCSGDGQVASTQFIEQGGACYLGAMKMMPDGTASDDEGRSYTWNGDTSTFNVCEADACLSCVPAQETYSAPVRVPSCGGVALSCGLLTGAACSYSGCSWNEAQQSCSGVPFSCQGMSQAGCGIIEGCLWN